MTVHVELDADHRANGGAFCFQAEPNDAANVGVIRYTNRVIAQLGRFSNESFGGDGAIAKGKAGMRAELDGHDRYVIPNKPRKQTLAKIPGMTIYYDYSQSL